jgi:hypothetical protein
MKKNLIFAFLLSVLCFLTTTISAQTDYKTAIGLRLGYPTSITFKKFINDKAAFELTAGYRSYGYSYGLTTDNIKYYSVSGSYQIHTPISSVAGLQWYYGGGVGVFLWTYPDYYTTLGVNTGTTSFNIFGLLGLDYKFEGLPINLSIDWAPTISLGGYASGFGGGNGALAARYTF